MIRLLNIEYGIFLLLLSTYDILNSSDASFRAKLAAFEERVDCLLLYNHMHRN